MAGLLNGTAAKRDAVAAELHHWARMPHRARRAICALSVLAYVERVRGQRLRPSPNLLAPIALAAIWLRPGNFEAFASWAMAQLGCAPTDQPGRGDVGLVDLAGSGLTACLCVGSRHADSPMWAARAAEGLVIESGVPTLAWRVPCRPQ